jgi:hypothetical protein
MGQSIKGEPNHLPVNDGRKSLLGEVHCLLTLGRGKGKSEGAKGDDKPHPSSALRVNNTNDSGARVQRKTRPLKWSVPLKVSVTLGTHPPSHRKVMFCRLVFLKVGDDGEDLAAMGVVPSGDHNGAMVRCHELPRRKDEQGGNDQCIGSEGQVSDKGKSPIRRNFLGLIGVKGYIEDAFHRPCQGFKSSPNSTMSILPA